MTRTDIFNGDVKNWTQDSQRKMKNTILRMVLNIGHGYNDLKATNKKYMGETNKISFSFPYYMVFVHKGAGRGYGGNKTGLFSRADGSKGTTSPASMGKMGTGKRVPKPWFNPVVEAQFPLLSNIVATYRGEVIILTIQKILID